MKFIIKEDNVLIKDYIRKTLSISSKTMTKLKPNGIFLNGAHARVVDFMNKGDVLELLYEDKKETSYEAEDIPLDIVYEDDNFLLLNKPPFMPVYPAGEHMKGSLLSAFAHVYKGIVYRPIYRLDRNTSGIVTLAKNRASVASPIITKVYLAVCEGIIEKSGVVTSPIGLLEGSRIIRTTGHGKHAHTEYEPIACDGKHSLVKVKILTGRTHQIRVHMSSIGHPLAGDDLYGGSTELINRHALHCYEVEIKCSAMGIDQIFKAEITNDIKNSFNKLFQ